MINREQFINEIAEVVNRNSMERVFNNTPDYILAAVAVEAMEKFALTTRMIDWKEPTNNKSCKGCPFTEICPGRSNKKQTGAGTQREYKKPEAHDVPKEVEAMAAFFADMFPGSKIQIQRVDLKKNPRNKRRAKNQRKNRK